MLLYVFNVENERKTSLILNCKIKNGALLVQTKNKYNISIFQILWELLKTVLFIKQTESKWKKIYIYYMNNTN